MTLVDRLRQLRDALPPHGSLVLSRDALEELLTEEPAANSGRNSAPNDAPATSWRERMWTCAPETRLGVRELAEALGRSPDGIYRLTGKGAGERRLPHRKLGGEIVTTVGELRAWLERNEALVHAGPEERRRRMRRTG